MNKVFFLIMAAAFSANDAFCQDQALPDNKKTAADGKESNVAGLTTIPDSKANSSGICTLDMKRSTAQGANTGALLKADSTLPQKLYVNDKKIITTPVKDEH